MNHGEGWIFVTAVISASKRNNFSSDFRGVSRKICQFSHPRPKLLRDPLQGEISLGSDPQRNSWKPPSWWPNMVKGLGGLLDLPEMSQAAFWWLWVLFKQRMSWIFLISTTTKNHRQYKNIKTLKHRLFSVWMVKKKRCPEVFCSPKQWGFILGSDKTPVPPAVLTHWECLGGEVAKLHEPALGAIAGSKKGIVYIQKKKKK